MWNEGRALQRLPCLVRALFVGWVGVGGRSVLLRVPWSGSAKVSYGTQISSETKITFRIAHFTFRITFIAADHRVLMHQYEQPKSK